ncbi:MULTISPECIES: efflux RND transporter periplasmic adaptor subunit [unclassified Spirosoma]|uniref:efflux RND transporter periplasmic adaptor subunit n=1 Tax=unclassified Spirosoma TaxID=2621999 RepID=UPI000966C132|nr:MULTISPECIES: efflux RND transporter periplasmic adaptor subunit [unclassified Spirosoma]MBN8823185.1 efflux RND transporter periplasmic adaptor subunit [Spirosoma sp.]OJW72664.1 MAG: efflux transporter periplasmic adaptor subunit [Spirosoma sp. 48-14]
MQLYSALRSGFQLAFMAGMTFLLSQCGNSSAEKSRMEEAPADEEIRYEAIRVTTSRPTSELNLPGELESYYETDIYPRVSSYVKALHVDIGDQVRKGQVLAELEAPELTANLTEAYSKVKAAEAVFGTSKATFLRVLRTSRTLGAISPVDLESSRTKAISDSLAVVAANAHYSSVNQLVSYLKITAPFTGVITDRRLSPGAFVGPGGQNGVPILKIKQLDRLRLRIAVPEAYLGDIRSGNPVKFTVRSFPNQTFTGRINRISNSVRPETRSEMVEIDFQNKGGKLKPGMFASVRLPVASSGEGSVYVPKSAVISTMERTFIQKVVDGKVIRTTVQKGDDAAGQTQVFGDVKPGDIILKTASEDIDDQGPIKTQLVN